MGAFLASGLSAISNLFGGTKGSTPVPISPDNITLSNHQIIVPPTTNIGQIMAYMNTGSLENGGYPTSLPPRVVYGDWANMGLAPFALPPENFANLPLAGNVKTNVDIPGVIKQSTSINLFPLIIMASLVYFLIHK